MLMGTVTIYYETEKLKVTHRWKLVRSFWFEAIDSTSWICGGLEQS